MARALAVGASLAACFWTDLYYTVFLVSAWGIFAIWRHRQTMQKAFTAGS